MGSFAGTCEIVEVREELSSVKFSRKVIRPNSGTSVSDKDRKLPVLKLGHKNTLEDDINHLFECIRLKTSSKGLISSDKVGTSTSPLRRNTLKKPVTAGMLSSAAIGASEPVSLKQALRDLCISKASEMAAMRRMSKSSSSPGTSEAGRIKDLYNSVVVESKSGPGLSVPTHQDKDCMLEVSLVLQERVPGSSKKNLSHLNQPNKTSNQDSNFSPHCDVPTTHKTSRTSAPSTNISASKNIRNREIKVEETEKDNNPVPSTSHSDAGDNTESKAATTGKIDLHLDTNLANKGVTTKSGQRGRLHSVPSSSSNNSNRVDRSTRNVPSVAKPAIKNKSSIKKKIKQGSTYVVDSINTNDEVNRVLDPTSSEPVCERCLCSLKNAKIEVIQDSHESNSNSSMAECDSVGANSSVRSPDSGSNTGNRDTELEVVNEIPKSKQKGEFSQSSKSSVGEYSSSTSISDDTNVSGSNSGRRPHMSKDVRWEAIRHVKMDHGVLGLENFNLLKKLGCGDIGTVYLAELISTNCLFAIKVMDNEFLARRKKMPRAQTEREILRILDHPFLPTLYAQFTSDNLSCLVMEYCPGGDLHVLRQKQLSRSFPEPAARFYVAEVLLALEYLHMLGIIYRDLKPENILVREDGHIMLTDFDLSLRCTVSPTLLNSQSSGDAVKISGPRTNSSCIEPFCVEPSCEVPCFTPRFLPSAAKTRKLKAELAAKVRSLPQLVAEPTDARSNSFVGTHEYLAPEIIKGEGHGAAVDWWTFGIFLYELLYGKTPFKGSENDETLANVVLQSLKFPDSPLVSFEARDLIRGLLMKDPGNRMGSEIGAAEIKQHPFFEGMNWALIRCAVPPELPEFYEYGVSDTVSEENESKYLECKTTGEHLEFELF